MEPEHVRLKPGRDDLYRWVPLPAKKHLLDKQLSRASIRDYQEVYAAVDVALEAVLVGEETPRNAALAWNSVEQHSQVFDSVLHIYPVPHIHRLTCEQDQADGSAGSFAARITQLTAENDQLRTAEQEWRTRASGLEVEVHEMQKKLHHTQVEIERLQAESCNQQEKFRQSLVMAQKVQEAAQALQSLTK